MPLKVGMLFVTWQWLTDIAFVTTLVLRNEVSKLHTGDC